jgi:hypothetical protein
MDGDAIFYYRDYGASLATSATYRPSGKNTKYDLVIATSRFFSKVSEDSRYRPWQL